jgi:hypothetical protein
VRLKELSASCTGQIAHVVQAVCPVIGAGSCLTGVGRWLDFPDPYRASSGRGAGSSKRPRAHNPDMCVLSRRTGDFANREEASCVLAVLGLVGVDECHVLLDTTGSHESPVVRARS